MAPQQLVVLGATGTIGRNTLDVVRRNAGRMQKSRKKLSTGLKRLGYSVYPSHANFVLARKPGTDAKAVYEALKRRMILVRYFDATGLRDCLRITIGTPKEIQRVLEELAALQI